MRIFARILLLLAVMIVLAVAVTATQVFLLRYYNPRSTAWMRMRMRQARAQDKPLVVQQQWVPLPQIPYAMQAAVVAAEDENFYEHHGFDWNALKKAYARNEKLERIKRGGSTITQQLAKNLYLSPARSYIRKAREAWITMTMELLLPKPRILELYLNLVEFGPGVFGVEAGAHHHFGVSARQLTANQACRLASILPAPLRYRINGNYVSRRASILQRILGTSPPPEETSIPVVRRPKPPPPADRITDSLLRELEKVDTISDPPDTQQ